MPLRALLLAATLLSSPAAAEPPAAAREEPDVAGLAEDAGNEETQGWTLPAMRGVPLRAPAHPPPPRRPPEGDDAWEQDGRGGVANEETRGWTWPGPAGTRP